MTSQVESRIDWRNWRDRWEAQQAACTVDWEGRYTAMLDAVAALLPEEFVAVDLASGPGTISRRLLDRFPKARCVAVDLDPVLLTMGQSALGSADGRLRWVEADLKSSDWLTALGEEDRKSTRLNSSHANISYAVFCLKKKIYKRMENIVL